jgi:hypothetical protein
VTFAPYLMAHLQQIQAKLHERTIGSALPANRVNQPVWEASNDTATT